MAKIPTKPDTRVQVQKPALPKEATDTSSVTDEQAEEQRRMNDAEGVEEVTQSGGGAAQPPEEPDPHRGRGGVYVLGEDGVRRPA